MNIHLFLVKVMARCCGPFRHPIRATKNVLWWMGLRRPLIVRIEHNKDHKQILIAGGYGYGNTGDEAQLGANLTRWRKARPDAELVVLSPNPGYTEEHHGVRAVPASRIVFFAADRRPDYGASSPRFQKEFWGTKRRLILAAWCMRLRLPTFTASQQESDFLALLASASMLHLSGGGYLTGMTRSRLWDHMLLLRLAKVLGVPSILTGHTIGVFQSRADRKLAKWGLQCPKLITVRDRNESIQALADIGIQGEHIHERFDDALFCDQLPDDQIAPVLRRCGLVASRPYVAVNTHDWGQSPEIRERLIVRVAELCDYMATRHNLQILFCPMVRSDENTIMACMQRMRQPSTLLTYAYDYRVVRAAIGGATLCLTMKHHPIIFAMGNAVPCLAASVDDYYYHKNAGALGLFELQRFLLHGDDIFCDNAYALIDTLVENVNPLKDAIRLVTSHFRHHEETSLSPLFLRAARAAAVSGINAQNVDACDEHL